MDLMDTPLSHLWQLDYVYTVGLHTHIQQWVWVLADTLYAVSMCCSEYNAGLKIVLQESSS